MYWLIIKLIYKPLIYMWRDSDSEPLQESNLSWAENQSGWAGKKPKDEYDETKLLWFRPQLNNCYLWMIRFEFF